MAKPKTQNTNKTADEQAPQIDVDVIKIRKITTATLWGRLGVNKKARERAKEMEKVDKPVEKGEFLVMRITGRVVASRTVSHPSYGDSESLIGSFVALSGADGKVYKANTLFLPGFMERDIMVAFSEHGAGVEFGYDLTARPREPDEVNSQPFEYVSYPLSEDGATVNNLMTALLKPSDTGFNSSLLLAAPEPQEAA
jgi:hypothetical protein